MWSEEQDNMDNRIRKAADSKPHPVDDGHWEKMETLLNEHLPEEKKRRRFLFILLLAGLLIGTGAITMITFSKKQQSFADKKTEPIEKKITNDEGRTIAETEKKYSTGSDVEDNSVKNDNNPILPEQNIQSSEKENAFVLSPVIKNKKEYGSTKVAKQKRKATITAKQDNDNEKDKITATVVDKNFQANTSTTNIITDSSSQNIIAAAETPAKSITEEVKADTINTAEETKEEKISVTKNKQSKFSILLSAGSDISGIGTKSGSPQLAYGVGIAYSLSDRWTIRTGLLAAVKKYDAKPEQYHPDNYNFWIYYPHMQKIDANCFVYEIPLNVVYNFNGTKNQNWFVSTGLSSFLMKRETYDYTFKDNLGQTRYTTRTLKNEYNHWFSVLDISGGYQYRFSNKFSLLAEPYIKMPLSGVGFGHVKLNSAGILITAAIKPFSKKEK